MEPAKQLAQLVLDFSGAQQFRSLFGGRCFRFLQHGPDLLLLLRTEVRCRETYRHHNRQENGEEEGNNYNHASAHLNDVLEYLRRQLDSGSLQALAGFWTHSRGTKAP